jgi:hypothetical protein
MHHIFHSICCYMFRLCYLSLGSIQSQRNLNGDVDSIIVKFSINKLWKLKQSISRLYKFIKTEMLIVILIFVARAPVQTGPVAHPTSSTLGWETLTGVKRPGRGVNHATLSSAQVKERAELYILWQVIGWTLPLYLGTSPTDYHSCT